MNWYLERVHQAASTNRHVCRAFFDVANLLAPAPTLFKPSIMARVWRECVSASRSADDRVGSIDHDAAASDDRNALREF